MLCVVGLLSVTLFILLKKSDKNDQMLNYNDDYNWASLPTISKDVDVFYVYPTVSRNVTGSMDITNDEERDLVYGIIKTTEDTEIM